MSRADKLHNIIQAQVDQYTRKHSEHFGETHCMPGGEAAIICHLERAYIYPEAMVQFIFPFSFFAFPGNGVCKIHAEFLLRSIALKATMPPRMIARPQGLYLPFFACRIVLHPQPTVLRNTGRASLRSMFLIATKPPEIRSQLSRLHLPFLTRLIVLLSQLIWLHFRHL